MDDLFDAVNNLYLPVLYLRLVFFVFAVGLSIWSRFRVLRHVRTLADLLAIFFGALVLSNSLSAFADADQSRFMTTVLTTPILAALLAVWGYLNTQETFVLTPDATGGWLFSLSPQKPQPQTRGGRLRWRANRAANFGGRFVVVAAIFLLLLVWLGSLRVTLQADRLTFLFALMAITNLVVYLWTANKFKLQGGRIMALGLDLERAIQDLESAKSAFQENVTNVRTLVTNLTSRVQELERIIGEIQDGNVTPQQVARLQQIAADFQLYDTQLDAITTPPPPPPVEDGNGGGETPPQPTPETPPA